jgi:ectoine hydroxylase-related dioxygenase (phytanoyl-CoA dioxygenase family)
MTEQEIQEYHREGYIVLRDLVRGEIIDEVLAASPAEYKRGGNWTPRVFNHDEPTTDWAIHQLLIEPAVVDAVEAIFESATRVYYGLVAVVPAGKGRGLPWHQDNMYSNVAGRALNVFMALCDIPPEKAGLWMAPRSHWVGLWPNHRAEEFGGHRESDIEPENGIQLPAMHKGDVCIFDRFMLHRSLINETNEDRYAYAAQYQEDKARVQETGMKDPRKMRVAELRKLIEN